MLCTAVTCESGEGERDGCRALQLLSSMEMNQLNSLVMGKTIDLMNQISSIALVESQFDGHSDLAMVDGSKESCGWGDCQQQRKRKASSCCCIVTGDGMQNRKVVDGMLQVVVVTTRGHEVK